MARKRKEIQGESVAEKPTDSQPSGFRIRVIKNAYTVVQITAERSVTLVHNSNNPQKLLKEVYDAGSQYEKLIEPPKGYKAPWQR